MTKRLILILAVLSLVVLSACQAAAPVAQPTEEPEEQNEIIAYPSPVVATEAPRSVSPGVAMYPDLQDGIDIAWTQAVAMILNGEVESVFQTHSEMVTLTLKDGRTFTAQEPDLDVVFEVIEACGDPCSDIEMATE